VIFGKHKSKDHDELPFDKSRMLTDLSYAQEYYRDHPEQIERIIEHSPLFYSYLREHWKDRWYCDHCRRWLPIGAEQCRCGQWQKESLRQKYVLRTPNKKITDCFALLEASLQAKPLPRFRIGGSDLYLSLIDADGDEGQTIVLLKQVVQKILQHLGLSPKAVTVQVNFVGNDDSSSLAGQYMQSGGQNSVVINVRPKYPVDTNISIACHECLHHYLFHNHIRLHDEKENEFLTDIAMIFCGMIGSVGVGYHEYSSYVTDPNDKSRVKLGSRYKVGYVSEEDLDYAWCLYSERRRQYIAEQQALLGEEIARLEKSIAYNEALFSRSVSSVSSYRLSPDELGILSENAAFIQFQEGREWLAASRLLPPLVDEAFDAEVKKYHRQLSERCMRLSEYNRLLNKLI
jgi:hypothetical protein